MPLVSNLSILYMINFSYLFFVELTSFKTGVSNITKMFLKKINHVLQMIEQKLVKGYWEPVDINNRQFQEVSLFTFNILILHFLKENMFYSIFGESDFFL